MKFVMSSMLSLSVAVVAGSAQAQTPDPAAAAKLLDQVAAAYQRAGALTDNVEITVSSGGQTQKFTLNLALGGDDSGRVDLNWTGITFWGFDGAYYITRNSLPTKCIRQDMTDGFTATLLGDSRYPVPLPQLVLRTPGTQETYVAGFGLGQLGNLTLADVKDSTRDGAAVRELRFVAPGGKVSAFIDSSTNLVDSMRLVSGPTTIDLAMHPVVSDALPTPVAFDANSRQAVDQLQLEAGDPAPDFSLPTLEGETVDLNELKGNMVVIDFWATWCGPCMKGLPEINKFAKWAAENELPVRVYAIDSFERLQTPEEKQAQIARVWKAKGFSFPTLLDMSMSAAKSYEVGPIPHTVIIDPEGNVHDVHIGFDPQMFSKLKDEARDLLDLDG